MGRLFVLLGLAALGQGEAFAATLYKCIDREGIPVYVSKPIAAADCTVVSEYVPQRWRFVTTSVKGSVLSYDNDTVVRSKGAVTVWLQSVHLGEKPYIPDKGRSSKTLSRERFSCEGMTSQTLSYADYDDKGNVLASGMYPTGTIPTPIVPDTVYESAWQVLCKAAAPSTASP